MKKLLCIIISLAMLIPAVFNVMADEDVIKVVINDASMIFDVSPIIRNNRVLVPMRAIFEALGCEVEYFEAEDGTKNIYAYKGTKSISLKIGSSELVRDYEETVLLDSPAIIYNNRTLVPVRAVSEALRADVSWNEDEKKVIIKEYGEHKIIKETEESNVEENGVLYINKKYTYPVIENPEEDSFIKSINEEIRKEIEEYDKITEENDLVNMAKEEYTFKSENGYEFYPYELSSNYNIECDKNGILSISLFEYYFAGGAHPSSNQVSFVYDMNEKKKLSLDDIITFSGESKKEFILKQFESFIERVAKDSELAADDEAFNEIRSNISEEYENVGYYLTDDSLVLFFVPYQVGPYALGYPSVKIPFEGNEEYFK